MSKREAELEILLKNDSERYLKNISQHMRISKQSKVNVHDSSLNEVYQNATEELNRRHRIRTGQEDIIGKKINKTL